MGTTLLIGKGVSATSANDGLAVFWASVTIGRLVIAVVSTRLRSTHIYVVLPWAIAIALAVFPVAGGAGAGIALFAFGGLACSGFFPMTIGYGEATFPSIVELAAGWLIAAYQVGDGLAAFGASALQHVVALTTVFRIAADRGDGYGTAGGGDRPPAASGPGAVDRRRSCRPDRAGPQGRLDRASGLT